jgi:hypothetical protein
MYEFALQHYMLYMYGEKVCIPDLRNIKVRKSQKAWVRKLQISIVQHLRKARKINKYLSCGFAMGETYLRTAYLVSLYA